MIRYAISALLILGALVTGIFYLKPSWENFRQIRAETERVRALSLEFDELLQNRDALIAKLNLVSKEELGRLEAIIPQGAQSLDYLIALQELARESGVGMTFTQAEISPAPVSSAENEQGVLTPRNTGQAGTPAAATPGQPQLLNPGQMPRVKTLTIKDLPVGVQISGSYERLKQFLERLERFGRLTDISAISFTASSGSEQAPLGDMQFRLTLKARYQ